MIAILMGSKSDYDCMQHCVFTLQQFPVAYECLVISAHRTPVKLAEYASNAVANGIKIIIAGAGGAAHLPGMLAAYTILPVLGVPIPSKHLSGLDSLYSIVQMPKGIPVGTLAIGEAGAVNAALLAIQILALHNKVLSNLLNEFRVKQNAEVLVNSKIITST